MWQTDINIEAGVLGIELPAVKCILFRIIGGKNFNGHSNNFCCTNWFDGYGL